MRAPNLARTPHYLVRATLLAGLAAAAGGCNELAVPDYDIGVDAGSGDDVDDGSGGAGDAGSSDAGDAGDSGGGDVGDAADGGDATSDADTSDDSGADADASPDGSGADAREDTEPDIVVPPGCGDGVLQAGEECDDGNDIDTDGCSNACIRSNCGDGILNSTLGEETFESPIVTHPNGATGYVCDDGSTCPEISCDLTEERFAPEHGICESLGFDSAVSVTWGGGSGAGVAPMLHASGWDCFDFDCISSEVVDTAANCAAWEMLDTIVCKGVVGEECDDGPLNGDVADACRSNCTLPFCGDGITDSDEECDDGNVVDDDGCSNLCMLPGCGDGVRNGSEECDDGDTDDLNACRNDCTTPRCGDLVVSAYSAEDTLVAPIVTTLFGATGHVCDDGGSCEGSTCDVSTRGTAPEHGICQALGYDRALTVSWGGGPGESDSVMPHAANWSCSGFVCSTGSTYVGDNCSSGEMLNEITCFGGFTEQCDLGDANSDTPDSACRTTCLTPFCGDGIVDTGEECDDGNLNEVDGCSTICRLPACGDRVVQGDEACDDGNDLDSDACLSDCTLPVCGDGIVSAGESCDEGAANSSAPDAACRPDCREQRCQDGIVDSGEECDDGNADSRDTCTAGCFAAFCGDGIRQRVMGEECDDGNADIGDGCDVDCLREAGAAPGHVVFIGHDFFERSAAIDRVVANAVALSEVSGTIEVLGFTELADLSTGGEVSNVNAAITALASTLGYTVNITSFALRGELASRIDAADVLVIYEQERGSTTEMTSIGTAWSPLLTDFIDRGGVIIVTDFSGDAWQILNASGVMPIASSRTAGSETVNVVAPSDLLATGLGASYPATNGSRVISLPAGSEAVVVASGAAGAYVVHLEN